VYLEAQGSTVTAKYGNGNALYRKDGEFPLFDGLGSERTVTNGSQTVTGTINFDAFGQTVGTTGSSSNPYMFAATSGYRSDGDAELMHVRARYYDGQVGRFVSRDKVLSEHPYLYCNADPVNSLDPSGHVVLEISIVVIWIAIAVVGAVLAYAAYHAADDTTEKPPPPPLEGPRGPFPGGEPIPDNPHFPMPEPPPGIDWPFEEGPDRIPPPPFPLPEQPI
jgi:RHS repeat-associated protein